MAVCPARSTSPPRAAPAGPGFARPARDIIAVYTPYRRRYKPYLVRSIARCVKDPVEIGCVRGGVAPLWGGARRLQRPSATVRERGRDSVALSRSAAGCGRRHANGRQPASARAQIDVGQSDRKRIFGNQLGTCPLRVGGWGLGGGRRPVDARAVCFRSCLSRSPGSQSSTLLSPKAQPSGVLHGGEHGVFGRGGLAVGVEMGFRRPRSRAAPRGRCHAPPSRGLR